MGRLLAVTSGKGGAGKSSVSVHLASSLSDMGNKVLLIDLDAGMRCLDIMLGVSDILLFDLEDVLSGNKSLEESIIIPPCGNGKLHFLAAPLKNKIKISSFLKLIDYALTVYDFVMLDFPAGPVDELYSA